MNGQRIIHAAMETKCMDVTIIEQTVKYSRNVAKLGIHVASATTSGLKRMAMGTRWTGSPLKRCSANFAIESVTPISDVFAGN